MAQIRERWGMAPDDWHVCLHMRDASHYGEFSGTGQTHRNSDVESYQRAVEDITRRGGWVIKLGGPRSPKLPKMKYVIDYGRSGAKSELLDLFLIRHSRYFIGTTSGLTNVAVSFGIPCALVNCITTDAQLWNSRVRFALKRVKLESGEYATQRQLTSTPWRWRMFGADVLARHGATLVPNTPEEILETVREVEALARDQPQSYTDGFADANDLLARWRASLELPHFYGSARPGLYYLSNHEAFLQDRGSIPRSAISVYAAGSAPRVGGQPTG
jgi:putative glycosyltransferase (TIGR04372 family)